jgi:putative ABC transport system permease protein
MWITVIREFFTDLSKQKLRSFLTLVAIAWGTLSVVLLLAFGRGLGTSMMEGMLGAGNQVIIIYGGQTSMSHEGLGIGRSIRFNESDVSLIERAVPGVEFASPQYGRGGTRLQAGEVTTNTFMEGVDPDFEIMRTTYPVQGGRFINEQDVLLQRRVVFLGNDIALRLDVLTPREHEVLELIARGLRVIRVTWEQFWGSYFRELEEGVEILNGR